MAKTLVTLNTSPSFTLVALNTSPSWTGVALDTSTTWLLVNSWSGKIKNWEDLDTTWGDLI
jgi:hypothetical protein